MMLGVPIAAATVGTATADFIGSIYGLAATIIRDVANAIASFVGMLISNPLAIFFVVGVLVFSLLWGPYHPVALQTANVVWIDVGLPVMRGVVEPLARNMAPLYTTYAAWSNFVINTLKKYVVDLAIIPFRCAYTTNLIRTVFRSIAPLSKSIVLMFELFGDAVVGDSSSPHVARLSVGLAFDAAANITDAASGVVGCYCNPLGYYTDIVVLFFNSENVQCTASNVLGLMQEALAMLMRHIYACFNYMLELVKWTLCFIFSLVFPGTMTCEGLFFIAQHSIR
jgi:hypothetical protein